MRFWKIFCFVLIITSFISGIPLSFASNMTDNEVSSSYVLKCNNENYVIGYHVTNASVTIRNTNLSNDGLVLMINNSSKGIITVVFPRGYIDERVGNTDNQFIILANGQMINSPIDTSNSTHRILTSNLPNGNFELEIPYSDTPEGLFAHHKDCILSIPEFPTTSLILSLAIMAVIIINRKQ